MVQVSWVQQDQVVHFRMRSAQKGDNRVQAVFLWWPELDLELIHELPEGCRRPVLRINAWGDVRRFNIQRELDIWGFTTDVTQFDRAPEEAPFAFATLAEYIRVRPGIMAVIDFPVSQGVDRRCAIQHITASTIEVPPTPVTAIWRRS